VSAAPGHPVTLSQARQQVHRHGSLLQGGGRTLGCGQCGVTLPGRYGKLWTHGGGLQGGDRVRNGGSARVCVWGGGWGLEAGMRLGGEGRGEVSAEDV
jgi:hypothetical protein